MCGLLGRWHYYTTGCCQCRAGPLDSTCRLWQTGSSVSGASSADVHRKREQRRHNRCSHYPRSAHGRRLAERGRRGGKPGEGSTCSRPLTMRSSDSAQVVSQFRPWSEKTSCGHRSTGFCPAGFCSALEMALGTPIGGTFSHTG